MWPSCINLSNQVWDKIKTIYKYTKSTKNEYATSVFFVNNELYVSPFTKGTKENVLTGHKIAVSYKRRGGDYYDQIILVDNKEEYRKPVKVTKIPQKSELGFLFNMHSHPPVQREKGGYYYSFYSQADISNLLASNNLISGLITNQLLLACKSRESKVKHQNLAQIFAKYKYIEADSINNEVLDVFRGAGIVFYKAEFGKKLTRIN
jgi:hypothetical protein